MKLRRNLFLTSLIAVAFSQVAHAASGIWTGSTNGNWHNAGNWTGGIPNAAADIATFNAASTNTAVSIENTTTTVNRIDFSGASTAAYTFSATGTFTNMVMSTNNGGVFIDSGVTTNQDLSGIPIIRPGMGDTINFSNQGSGSLKLGTFQAHNPGGTNLEVSTMVFAPNADGGIEIVTDKKIDKAGTNSSKNIAIILDDVGTLRIAAIGTYDGSNTDGNSVSIRQGTLEAAVIKNSGTQSSLGSGGRIQFGQASTTNTATLDYYGASDTTNRAFQIIDNNTAVFKVSGSSSTNLAITSAITESAATNGGGNLTKDGVGTLTLSANNTYTGDTLVNNGTLALSSTGGLKFVIGADDVNNKILGTGAGTITLDGLFTFDLTTASTILNDSWNIVDVANLDESYGSNFNVDTFTRDGGGTGAGIWTKVIDLSSSYQFNTTTGTLTVIPEPSAALLGGLGLLALLRRRR